MLAKGQTVYLLIHARDDPDRLFMHNKLIGVFLSERAAEDAREKLEAAAGFEAFGQGNEDVEDYEGFGIVEFKLDETRRWEGGFTLWGDD